MPTIDVSRIVNDPRFAQSFTVLRSTGTGAFQQGGYAQNSVTLTHFGVIEDSNPDEIWQAPEADRITGSITVWDTQELFRTNPAGTSDVVVWRGHQYKVYQIQDRSDMGGFWRAVCVAVAGD